MLKERTGISKKSFLCDVNREIINNVISNIANPPGLKKIEVTKEEITDLDDE